LQKGIQGGPRNLVEHRSGKVWRRGSAILPANPL